MRKSSIHRKSNETDICIDLNIDGKGAHEISTGCGFLDHMLELFSKHGRFDINLSCNGDTQVDMHHTTEDIGICLGNAFNEALGDRRGIKRYASIILPMDETLVLVSLDLSGRTHLNYKLYITNPKVGEFDTELVKEFFYAFSRSSKMTLHIKQLEGGNSHHLIEAAFKAFARALRNATEIDEKNSDEIPSTKGIID